MRQGRDRLIAQDLAKLAHEAGISLGSNPVRTILYYKQLGLLSPHIVQEGSVRRAYYSRDHVTVLQLIKQLQARGFTLPEIRNSLQRQVYLSPEGRRFVEQFRSELPSTAFLPGEPVTRAEMAFLLNKSVRLFGRNKAAHFLLRAFVGPHEELLELETLAPGLQAPEQWESEE